VADLLPYVADQPLVDHHCHGVLRRDADVATLESMLSEGAGFPGGSVFDSQAGFMFRRLCPPVLGLPPHAELGDYVARRAELGSTEVSKRFLVAAGAAVLCVDTGYVPEPITSPAELGDLAGATAHEIVRLERVAEDVAAAGVGADGFADAVRSALAARTASAVGVKSIAAYRTGLELGAERPADSEVATAAGRWLADAPPGSPRLADETLQRFLVWCGVDLRLPVQFHVGYGDSDVDLHRCNPLLLTPLLRPARLRRRRAGNAQPGRARAGAAGRGPGAGAVREVPVLLGRVRPARAVLPGRGAVQVRPVGVPALRPGAGSVHRTDRGAAGPDAVRRQRQACLPARRSDVMA
jgi:hypothetical protein